MEEDESLQRSHEEERGRARIADAQLAGGGGAAEIVGHDGKAAPRRVVALWVEGEEERGVLRHHDVAADHLLGEGDELFRDVAKDRPRVRGGGGGCQLQDAGGGIDDVRAAHGLAEEGVLGVDMAEKGGWGDVQLAGDVGEGGGGESLGGEDAPGGGQDLIAADARRAAHL